MAMLQGQCGDRLYWSLEEDSGRLTISGSGPMWDYTRCWEDGPVPTWRGQGLELRLEEGITSIGRAAFEGCFVEELTLPSTIKAIGEAAFDECGITQLSLNEGLEVIGEIAFFGNAFAEVHLPSTVKVIGDRAFGGPAGFVRRAVIPTGLEEIGGGEERHIFGVGFDAPEHIELYGAPVADWNLWWPILAFMEGEVIYPADWKESDLPDRRIFALYPGVDPEMAEEEDFGQIWTPKEE